MRNLGNFAQIEAAAREGYNFDGWYEGDTLVCENETYRFCVEKDIELVARFSPNEQMTELETENETNDDKVAVNTGDNNVVGFWLVLMLTAVVLVTIISSTKNKKDVNV